MAELIGVVSAGAGLVSLSLQLLETAQKLKHFSNDAKNAPKSLGALSDDLDLVAMMLQNLEQYRLENNVHDDKLLERCIGRVQSIAKDISSVVGKLEQCLERSRILGKFSAAFKEPEIQKYLCDLEHGKSSLILAHQLYVECVTLRTKEVCFRRGLTAKGHGGNTMYRSNSGLR